MATITPASSINLLRGVGPVAARTLASLGIASIEDLLWHIPFRYEDYRDLVEIQDLKIGQIATVRGVVELIASRRSHRRRLSVTEGLLRDDTGSIKMIWFNQPYLANTIKPGDHLILSGKVTDRAGMLQIASPSYEKLSQGATIHTGRLVPVYSTTAGITQRQMRYFVSQALPVASQIDDWLPEEIRTEQNFPTIAETLSTVHFPEDEQERDRALQRLKFHELFLFQLRRQRAERSQKATAASPIPFAEASVKSFVASLPFRLTAGQKRCAWDIMQDCMGDIPMYRLLEGDVGSGKTVVAALASLNALESGFQVAVMAPTEILARQHFVTFASLLPRSATVLLWTHGFRELSFGGRQKSAPKTQLQSLLSSKKPLVAIGTHALLEEGVSFATLNLVIIDEQHRFGVAQRRHIQRKGAGRNRLPHLLSLTATPIPRSLALTIAGDLKLSILRELPKGRKPVSTRVMEPHQRDAAYRVAYDRIREGRQAFCIAPLIEPSDALGVASATELFQELRDRFPGIRCGLLHGKLPSAAKDGCLRSFAEGDIDLLVATPVVEVGIDVPNATVMIIEGAERFGLAQLHQLRGRIGRGDHPSSCFLLASSLTPIARKRLSAVAATTDGFTLAELDLKLRGPGDFVGTMQSGFLDFRFASFSDAALMQQALSAVKTIMQRDPLLRGYPGLRVMLRESNARHQE